MSRHKPKYTRQTLSLKDKHTWKAPPDHRIVLLDRGAVRFNIPESWVVEPDAEALKVYDKQPPADDCRLSVTYIRTPPADWSELPLAPLLESAASGDHDLPNHKLGEVISV